LYCHEAATFDPHKVDGNYFVVPEPLETKNADTKTDINELKIGSPLSRE
jgi:hypothetical protein